MYVIIALIYSFLSLVSATNSIEGDWNTGRDNSVVTILNQGETWSGVIKSSDKPKAIGKSVLRMVKKEGDVWRGQIFSFEKQEWYDAELILDGDKLEIEVTVGIFSKTIEWTKA